MAMTRNQLDDLSGMRWLVAARNEIQNLMADLYERFPSEHVSVKIESEKQLHLVLGAAFSLWRAVFLISPEDAERSIRDIGSNARAFLKRVIDTNAILFGDELKWRAWSGGYYLNNAKHRILRLGKNDEVAAGISEAVLKRVWNTLYSALAKAVSELPPIATPTTP